MLNVFIVRPFGTKNGIDFDKVERDLIRPAMELAGLSGGTTGEFLQQGNIRTDMFEQLLIADLVTELAESASGASYHGLGLDGPEICVMTPAQRSAMLWEWSRKRSTS